MKIATVPYINSLPLTQNLSGEVKKIAPSQMEAALLSGEIDVALIPIVSALKQGLHLYPECGVIGCDGRVMSVAFYIKNTISNFTQIKSIYWDTESSTSIQLAKILLKKFHKVTLDQIQSVTYENRLEADAKLLIGDKALFTDKTGYNIWDLGKMWKQATDKGFVFACWASKKPLDQTEKDQLIYSKEKGLASLETITKNFPEEQQALLNKYLTNALVYEFTPPLKEGLELFKTYLKEI